MKNEQNQDQKRKQEQEVKNAALKNQQEPNNQSDPSQEKGPGKTNQQSQGNEKSNISVNSDGKIGKVHDQWNNANNNRNEGTKDIAPDDQQKDKQLRNDKTVTEPEIDAPIYEPGKTEKKIPQMGNNKKQ